MNEDSKNLRTLVIREEIKATAFSFYTAEEIKKISVKRILTTASLDVLGNPIPGGLYDPAMGPINRFETYIANLFPFRDFVMISALQQSLMLSANLIEINALADALPAAWESVTAPDTSDTSSLPCRCTIP